MAKRPATTSELTISSLIEDADNANAGTDRGNAALERSIRAFGVGRPVVVDKHNRLVAGNKTKAAAERAGVTKTRVVETTGDELIVHKRTDLDLESPTDNRARALAIADNRISQTSQNMDMEVVVRQIEVHAIDPADVGYEIEELTVAAATGEPEKSTTASSSAGEVGQHFGIYVECESEQEQRQVFEALTREGRKAKLLTL